MKNVVYSATRQWNPGDEFILQGSINLIQAAIGEHNAILYNRHPGLRPLYGEGRFRRVREDWSNPQVNELEKDFQIGFFDNSVKFDTDLSFADYAVIAGSPECFNRRTENFYYHIGKNNIPLLALGVGHVDDIIPEWVLAIFQKALLKTVRSPRIKEILQDRFGIMSHYFPCPALFCIPCGREKQITEVHSIALVFAASARDSIPYQEISDEAYDFTRNFYRTLLDKFRPQYNFEIVCHYIDELPVAFREFKNFGVDIRYSFNAQEYEDIYRKADLVISPRVHGCGIASSLGIPSLHISHDALRSDTTDGFHAYPLAVSMSLEDSIARFSEIVQKAEQANRDLLQYKHSSFAEYMLLIRQAMQGPALLPYAVTLPEEPESFANNPTEVLAAFMPKEQESNTPRPPKRFRKRLWNFLVKRGR